jgi:hypothetical protein
VLHATTTNGFRRIKARSGQARTATWGSKAAIARDLGSGPICWDAGVVSKNVGPFLGSRQPRRGISSRTRQHASRADEGKEGALHRERSAWLRRGRPQVKYRFIARHRAIWPTRTMCRVRGVSTSGFYDWFERPESLRPQGNAALLLRIRESFAASARTYGAPRSVRDLHDDGLGCSENCVAWLMRVTGIKARHKQRRQPAQILDVDHSIAP